MKISGSATVPGRVEVVWDALRDPAVLVRTIPGCRRLEEVGPDSYRMTVLAGVAAVRGLYQGEVELSEPRPPHAFVLRAQGAGAPGTVEARVRVALSGAEDGVTRVDYTADAVVGGMLGGVGQRMLAAVSRRMAGEFFAAVGAELAAGTPAEGTPARAGEGTPAAAVEGTPVAARDGARPAAAAGAHTGAPGAVGAVGGRVFTAPDRAGRGAAAVPAWAMAGAFGAGGLVALLGVLIGWLIGRRRS